VFFILFLGFFISKKATVCKLLRYICMKTYNAMKYYPTARLKWNTLFFILLFFNSAHSQIVVTNQGASAATILSGFIGSGLTISNPTINCKSVAYGTFSGGTGIGVTNGVALTTGLASQLSSPASTFMSTDNNQNCSDPQLTALESTATNDCCILEFDVIPECNSISVRFVFGSEEYPNFVNSSYNDAFGFFVTGPNPAGGNYTNKNIAVVTGTTICSIDNVNSVANSAFYVNNSTGTTLPFGGYTTAITSALTVTPCQSYHFKIAIADASDGIYDSAVLIDFLQCTTALTATTTAVPTTCNLSNGTATAVATGGIGTLSYTWSPAPGGGQGTATATGLTGGENYTVTVDDIYPCTLPATSTILVPVSVAPSLVVTNPAAVCSPATVNITAAAVTAGSTGGGDLSYWTDAACTIPLASATAAAIAVSGTYYIKSTLLTCTDIEAVVVTINPAPTVTVNSPGVCAGASATVVATPSAGTFNYAWTVPAGATAPGNVATFSTLTAGTYSVIVTDVTTSCVSTSASGIVSLSPLPTVTVNSPAVCAGASATVTATPSAGTFNYAWTVPAGATAPGNVASFSTLIAGTYSVIVTNTVTGCVSLSASGIVSLSPLPTVTVNSPTVCSGASATITATPSAGTFNYAWTVPAGAAAPGNVASFSTLTAGTYSVIITDVTTTCVSLSASGIVSLAPQPTVTVNSPTVCLGASATVTATPSAGTFDYAWTVPAGASAPGNVATFGTLIAGTYSVIVTNTVTGCVSLSGSGTVTVNPIPTVTVNNPSVCAGASATVIATPSAGTFNYAWTVPAGATAPGNVASFSTLTAGTYSVIVTDVTTTCPSLSASGIVSLSPLPTVTVNSPTVCSGASATVTATPSAGTFDYAWTVPAGATAPGNVATFGTLIAGTYSVIITDVITTCVSTSASGLVSLDPIPTVTVNSPTVCLGTSATVTATPSAGTFDYAWTVPAGAAAPGNVATFGTLIAGTYSVIVTNTVTGCVSLSGSGTVTVNPIPTVTVNNPSVCAGASATVTATPSAGTFNYAWTVPAGATAPGNVASFSTLIAGTYSVIVTDVTTTCVSLSASGIVSLSPLPTVTVNSPTVCSGASATVTAAPSSGTFNYAWTVPAGATAPGNVATFGTLIAGTYSVIITDVITTCVSTSASGLVSLDPIPTVTVNSPTVCLGTSATVTATPSAGTFDYEWTVPAGAAAPGNVATFGTLIAGTYSVIVTNTVTGCVSLSGSGTVTVNPIPTVTVNNPSVCAGASATVTATPSAGTFNYAWTVPAGATAPGNVASFSTLIAGTYSVIVTDVTTTCVSLSASGIVSLNPLPTVTVNSSSVCAGASATVTAAPSAGTFNYAWTVPAGATAPGNVATFGTLIGGSYSVVITNTITGCVSTSATGVVTVNPLPTVTVNGPTVCAGTSATITATPSAGTFDYAWTVPAGAAAPGNVATFGTLIGGSYSVTITNTLTTCIATGANVMTVNMPITPLFSTFAPLCEDDIAPVLLQSSFNVPPITGDWDEPLIDVNTPGTVLHTFTPTAGQCATTTSLNIVVNPKPLLFVTAPAAICAPGVIDLKDSLVTAGSTGVLTYFTDASLTTEIANPSAMTTSGTYFIKATSNLGCFDYLPVVIAVNPKPIADFTPTPSVLNMYNLTSVMVNTSIGADTYEWVFEDNSETSTSVSPSHTYADDIFGEQVINLIVTSVDGCKDTTVGVVNIEEELVFYVPNAFTPDADDHNPGFLPVFTSGYDPFNYSMWIYNRWGELIFETHDTEIGWRGLYGVDGVKAQDGVYTWKMEFKLKDKDKHVQRVGHVTLVR
jgi:mucin-2